MCPDNGFATVCENLGVKYSVEESLLKVKEVLVFGSHWFVVWIKDVGKVLSTSLVGKGSMPNVIEALILKSGEHRRINLDAASKEVSRCVGWFHCWVLRNRWCSAPALITPDAVVMVQPEAGEVISCQIGPVIRGSSNRNGKEGSECKEVNTKLDEIDLSLVERSGAVLSFVTFVRVWNIIHHVNVIERQIDKVIDVVDPSPLESTEHRISLVLFHDIPNKVFKSSDSLLSCQSSQLWWSSSC